jgi:hypothetical protein
MSPCIRARQDREENELLHPRKAGPGTDELLTVVAQRGTGNKMSYWIRARQDKKKMSSCIRGRQEREGHEFTRAATPREEGRLQPLRYAVPSVPQNA